MYLSHNFTTWLGLLLYHSAARFFLHKIQVYNIGLMSEYKRLGSIIFCMVVNRFKGTCDKVTSSCWQKSSKVITVSKQNMSIFIPAALGVVFFFLHFIILFLYATVSVWQSISHWYHDFKNHLVYWQPDTCDAEIKVNWPVGPWEPFNNTQNTPGVITRAS